MLTKLLIGLIAVLVLAYFIIGIFFSGIPKDIWAKEFKLKTPTAMCYVYTHDSSTNSILLANNISYEKCISLISPSVNKCTDLYLSSIPSKINPLSGGRWGSIIGKCAGDDFYNRYIAQTSPVKQ